MKKILLIGIVGLLACSVDVNAITTTSVSRFDGWKQVTICSAKPKVVTRGDCVIIIYDDGTTIVVDKGGGSITIPPKP